MKDDVPTKVTEKQLRRLMAAETSGAVLAMSDYIHSCELDLLKKLQPTGVDDVMWDNGLRLQKWTNDILDTVSFIKANPEWNDALSTLHKMKRFLANYEREENRHRQAIYALFAQLLPDFKYDNEIKECRERNPDPKLAAANADVERIQTLWRARIRTAESV